MKKNLKLLVLLIIVSVYSCSSDDDPQPQTSQLVKIEQKLYDNGVLNELIIIDLDNEKPTLFSFYDTSNVLTATSNFVYNTSGLLIEINDFSADNIPTHKYTITYDSQNRIVSTYDEFLSSPSSNKTVTFTHNSDNTITSVSTANGFVVEKTFNINSNGLIDEELINGVVVVSVQYDNLLKPTSVLAYSNTSNYTYHPTGKFPFIFQNLLGVNPINSILYKNSIENGLQAYIKELVTQISSAIYPLYERVYTFNADNFALTRKDYTNSILTNEFDYFYD